ncbi:MAG: hypothetical protein EBS72_07045 [Rhizobiales bacterium]|nr:hypothetical protein [Hyphomicrobiales bacterium]
MTVSLNSVLLAEPSPPPPPCGPPPLPPPPSSPCPPGPCGCGSGGPFGSIWSSVALTVLASSAVNFPEATSAAIRLSSASRMAALSGGPLRTACTFSSATLASPSTRAVF